MSNCCNSKEAQPEWDRKDEKGNSTTGGFVMCCCGKKVPCNRPDKCPGDGSAFTTISCACTIAHERVHINERGHAECREDCNPHPSYPTEGYGGGSGECAAYKAGIECLERQKGRCARDPDPEKCKAAVEGRKQWFRNHANDRYKCTL
jgi:hypothetical protein